MPRRQFELRATIFDKRGRVLSRGENSYTKSHPFHHSCAMQVGRVGAIYLHAETQAIVRLPKGSKPYRIYIERYSRVGEPLPAKPCEICEIAIQEAGIEIVEHT